MANKFQKLLYNLSAISPILWIFSALWYLEKSEVFVSVLSTGIGIVLAVYYFVLIYLCKNKMAKISIITQEIIPNDKWLIGYLIAYAIPFTSLAFDDINVIIFSLVSIVIVTPLFKRLEINFNPRSHVGATKTESLMNCNGKYFNPRSHVGSDKEHLPLKVHRFQFQSTLPRRERPFPEFSRDIHVCISIHAPT